jgi:hypothetical protein
MGQGGFLLWCDKCARRVLWFHEQPACKEGTGCEM